MCTLTYLTSPHSQILFLKIILILFPHLRMFLPRGLIRSILQLWCFTHFVFLVYDTLSFIYLTFVNLFTLRLSEDFLIQNKLEKSM